jgi:hypothetical protein
VLGVSCGDEKPQPPPNREPTVNSLTAQPTEVASGGTVALALDASDPDGNELTYTWRQEPAEPAGTFAAARSPAWTAPQVSTDTFFVLGVTVADGKGGTDSGSVTVKVLAPASGNQAPVLTEGPLASPDSVAGASPVTLTVTATDADNDALTYAWTQVPAQPAGTFSDASSRTPTWVAPSVSSTQLFTLQVTVSDGKGGSVQGARAVSVNPPASGNHAPVLSEGPTASPTSLKGLDQTQLSVTATDEDFDSLTYTWIQEPASPAGTFSNTAARLSRWTAPTVNSPQTFTLKVVVSDGKGGSVQGQVDVTVTNHAPVLTAGPSASPASVEEQQPVNLSVTALDEDNDALTYAWEQVVPDASQGTFSSTSVANPTWTSPDVSVNTVYTLRVTVTDARGSSVQGTVDVVARKVNRVPTVGDISAPTTLLAGSTGDFSVTATDPDGDALTYAWSQTAPASQGTFVGSSNKSAQWFSPSVATQTSFTLSVSVTDGQSDPVVRTVSVPVTVPRYTDVQAVWNTVPSCTGCHGTAGGLSLSAANSYANLVNATTVNAACNTLKRVLPGDPDNSALVRKMEGTTCGTRMPSNNTAHFTNNPGQLVRVRSWILAGAAND